MLKNIFKKPAKAFGTIAIMALSLFVVSCGEMLEGDDTMSAAMDLGSRSGDTKILTTAKGANAQLYLTPQANQNIALDVLTENFANTDTLIFVAGDEKPILTESFEPAGYRLYHDNSNEYSELWKVRLTPIKDRFIANTRRTITIKGVNKDNQTIQKISNSNLVSRVGGGEDLVLNIPVTVVGIDTNMPCNMRISRIGKVCGDNKPIAVVYGFDKNSNNEQITNEVVTDLLYGRLRDTDTPNQPYFSKSVVQLTKDRKMTDDPAETESKGVAVCLTGFELDGATRIRGRVTTKDSGTAGSIWLSWHVDSQNK